MSEHGREQSPNRRRAETRKKIDDQTKMAEELRKEVDRGSTQFKELTMRARDLRRVFEELDKEHADRERTGFPGHVKDNVEWDQKRNRLHQVYHSIKSHLDQTAPKEEGTTLEPFKSRKLKNDGAVNQARRQERRALQDKKRRREKKSQVRATSVRSVFSANALQLKQFLETKDLSFKEKLISLKRETSREAKKEALAQVLIKWLSRVEELETAVRDT
jgi:hypothetical protein